MKKEKFEEIIEEIISLADRIESEGTPTFEEWRAFKRFRNALRDKYLPKKSNEA